MYKLQLELFKNQLLHQIQNGNYKELYSKIDSLDPVVKSVVLDDIITIKTDEKIDYTDIAKKLKSWRKGPFQIDDLFIDSEWQSFKKYSLIRSSVDLKNREILDIGCNNGYYLFRMQEFNPKSLTGIDPMPIYYLQFLFLNRLIRSDVKFELIGVQHLPEYNKQFDVVFCLGVLYHRTSPIDTLKSIRSAIKKGGELVLDTFIIDGEMDLVLSPKERYSKIPNIWFVPTITALKNWLNRTGFCDIEIIDIVETKLDEQRKTEWIEGDSLESFLDPADPTKTVEGYDAPKRAYIKARRK